MLTVLKHLMRHCKFQWREEQIVPPRKLLHFGVPLSGHLLKHLNKKKIIIEKSIYIFKWYLQNLRHCKGASVTRSNMVCEREIPLRLATPLASAPDNVHFRFTSFEICSAHNFSGKSTSDRPFVKQGSEKKFFVLLWQKDKSYKSFFFLTLVWRFSMFGKNFIKVTTFYRYRYSTTLLCLNQNCFVLGVI